MAARLGVGIIGCGNISAAYMELSRHFAGFEIRACADLSPAAAQTRAAQFGLRAETPEALLEAADIDLVVNLTIPAAHHAVSRRALEAGKHVYSEKPFVLDVAQGLDLAELAAARGLRIGSAPDTFMGGAHQFARHLLDAGAVGRIVSGTCHVMSPGMESWHPDPGFFFKPGAGPVLDIGPYYVANLVQLLGPVRRVTAMTATPSPVRTIGSQPRRGQTIAVETPTTIHAILEFAQGALVTLAASWDVWSHGHAPMELYGEDGSLFLPDPNFFGGDLRMTRRDRPADALPAWEHPLGVDNQQHPHGMVANWRGAGLADMALAIVEGRPHRCSPQFALHAVDVMVSILEAGETGARVELRTACERPAALDPAAAAALMA